MATLQHPGSPAADLSLKVKLPLPRLLLLAALAVITALPLHAQDSAQDVAQNGGDPPDRVARLSYIQGNVSLQPAGVDQFSQAEANYPLTSGDRVYADNTSEAELESDALAVRLGPGADLTITGLTDQLAQLGLAQGSIHVRSWSLNNGGVIEIDTPNGTITVLHPGDVRIASYPQDDSTIVTVNSGQAQASGPNFSELLNPGQSIRLTGSDPIYVEDIGTPQPDDFDRFDQDRDRVEMAGRFDQQQYVNADMVGYSDLQQYGDWTPDSDYGQVWYPRGVAVDWTPYHYGHWAWIAPWGWTWVESEPWGFAPFHYGRWAVFGGRWGWVPGPIIVRPVYSPALVAFVGGPNFSISVGFGGGPGAGVTAWFPLGPREPYIPWYHASAAYVNRVNVTNIYNRNATEVRNVYNNRTTNVYVNNTTVNNINYVNRNIATTAVPQKSFAEGRPVAASAIRVDQRQLAQAQVVPHPMVTPTARMMTPAPARAVPVNVARPVLQTHAGFEQAVPGAQPRPAPVRPATEQQQAGRPQQTAEPQAAPIQRQSPTPRQAPAQTFQPRPADQPRPLINRSEPPPAQPSFAQQQRAIEETDPGRPLGPNQVENVRNGRPAGPAQQSEPISHPQPQSKPSGSKPQSNDSHHH